MALPNPLPNVQGSRLALGPDGGWQDTFLIVPGVSDYVTGGYAITATQCRLKNIQTANVTGANATAVATWGAETVFSFVQIGGVATGAGITGYSQFLFYVYVLIGSAQVGSGASLSGAVWQVTVTGY
jgi:hypothetical protein